MIAVDERPSATAPRAEGSNVLIYAPLGRDADILAGIAREAGANPVVVAGVDGLAAEISKDCVSLIVTEEALDRAMGEVLLRHLEGQPSWSALPILALVANAGRTPPGLRLPERALERTELIVLQRPTRTQTLRTALVTLIGSRMRQLKVRDQIEDLGHKERHQSFLLSELDHRVKNLLAKILSILSLTRREANDLETFVHAFEARTRALAEAHQLLNGHAEHPGTLRALVENVMAPYRTLAGSNLRIDGPELHLWSKAGLALAMALHELATNASKYGALSRDEGVVSIRWHLADGTLTFEWEERGGPPVGTPTRNSFGTRLLRSYTSMEIGGAAELEFRAEGLRWVLKAPVARS